MEGLLQSLSQSSAQILLGVLIVLALTMVLALRNTLHFRRYRQQWSGVLQGSRGESLEKLLHDTLQENGALRARLDQAEARLSEIEKHGEKAKRHLGLVRYDAFEDVGGNQSFALALYDDNGDGAILNGLIGRADCRIYCKPLAGGRSDRNLSQEERRAISEALSLAPKSAVTGPV